MKRKAQIGLEELTSYIRNHIDLMKRDPSYYKLSDSSLASEGFWKFYYFQNTEEKKSQVESLREEVSSGLNIPIQDKDSVINVPAGTFSAEWYAHSAKVWLDTAFKALNLEVLLLINMRKSLVIGLKVILEGR